MIVKAQGSRIMVERFSQFEGSKQQGCKDVAPVTAKSWVTSWIVRFPLVSSGFLSWVGSLF
jgi:hypothetical protein